MIWLLCHLASLAAVDAVYLGLIKDQRISSSSEF